MQQEPLPPLTINVSDIALRRAEAGDDAFLFGLYAGTRAEEIAAWGWDELQQTAFLQMQFGAQQRGYQAQHPNAQSLIILLGEQPVGRTLLARSEDEIRLIEIAILPQFRGAGIGTEYLRRLLGEAREAQSVVSLSVMKDNPAQKLYNRLGFVQIGENELYFSMEWRPAADAQTIY
ncbi:MAG TPA: GNAT family N-acetyltransferase [Abditibacteriaceae bacterium]